MILDETPANADKHSIGEHFIELLTIQSLYGMQEVIGSTPLSSTLSRYVVMSYDAKFGGLFLGPYLGVLLGPHLIFNLTGSMRLNPHRAFFRSGLIRRLCHCLNCGRVLLLLQLKRRMLRRTSRVELSSPHHTGPCLRPAVAELQILHIGSCLKP